LFSGVKECEVGAQCRGPPARRQGRLQKVMTGALLDIVAVDILSGLPTTPDGKRYILVLTDYFTEWACAFALPDAEASTCMRVMYDDFFAEFGLPRQLHSDLGKRNLNPNCSTSYACLRESTSPIQRLSILRVMDRPSV